MKKIFVAAAVTALVVGGASMALAGLGKDGGRGLGISALGSPHNFADNLMKGVYTEKGEGVTETGANGWNSKRSEICRVCHTPHDHKTDYALNGPLWDRSLSNVQYTVYSSDTMNATVGQPTGNSKLCLACHDGSMTLNSDTFETYVNKGDPSTTATRTNISIAAYSDGFQVPNLTGNANDLRGTHPLSITYDAATVAADGALKEPATSPFIQGASAKNIKAFLEDGTLLQCSTCHDVHDSAANSIPGTHLLRAPTKGNSGNTDGKASALCLSCHLK